MQNVRKTLMFSYTIAQKWHIRQILCYIQNLLEFKNHVPFTTSTHPFRHLQKKDVFISLFWKKALYPVHPSKFFECFTL